MPTKTEQADLLAAMYGRHGESPIPIVAASSPSECFEVALEAARVAVRYRTPVIVLSDTFLQNSSEPWRLPDVAAIEPIDPMFAHPNGAVFQPYSRDDHGARPWAIPGTPGLQHRIGGLEREDITGAISYDAENHERMTDLRREKVQGIARTLPPLEVDDPTGDADLLVLGWGSTAGSIRAAVGRARDGGAKIARAHLRWLNPMPTNTGEVLARYPKVLIPEINEGQLALLVRAKFLVDARSFSRVQGRPIWADELDDAIEEALHD
jgi:2-oxoglutarate/2-oxoacid ferredoxin oxidoreductase subunit alpha